MLKKELNKGTIHSESMYKREFFPASNDLFKMIIADDGAGMEAGKKTIGIGLKNIKGRPSIFNGIGNIQTAPGKGFALEITMP